MPQSRKVPAADKNEISGVKLQKSSVAHKRYISAEREVFVFNV